MENGKEIISIKRDFCQVEKILLNKTLKEIEELAKKGDQIAKKLLTDNDFNKGQIQVGPKKVNEFGGIIMKYTSIFDSIYKFYPRKCKYDSEQYQNSKEYIKYLEILTDIKQRRNVSEMSYDIVESVFSKYYIKSWTNSEQPSIHYSILLHENQPILDDDIKLLKKLKGKRIDLEIYVSLLTKKYYVYAMETKNRGKIWEFNVYDFSLIVDKEKMYKLFKMFSEKGYSRLTRSCVNEIVPLIETELHYEGEVKVFHCLFSELEKIF